jgi:hypothetical protein
MSLQQSTKCSQNTSFMKSNLNIAEVNFKDKEPFLKKYKIIETKHKKCHKWKLCGINEAYNYSETHTKYCKLCMESSKMLYLVHCNFGDYLCYDCHKPVDTVFYCTNCKIKNTHITRK